MRYYLIEAFNYKRGIIEEIRTVAKQESASAEIESESGNMQVLKVEVIVGIC